MPGRTIPPRPGYRMVIVRRLPAETVLDLERLHLDYPDDFETALSELAQRIMDLDASR